MKFIIIAVIIFLIVRHFKNKIDDRKPTQVFSIGDPSTLPDTLSELRKMRDKAKSEELSYQCSRKICELGIRLCKEGKIVNDRSSEYDVSKLLSEMYQFIHQSHMYDYIPVDNDLEFRCLEAGSEVNEKLNPSMDGDVFNFTDYAWDALARFYTEGKVCPRDPAKARKYYRMRIIYESRMKDMNTQPIRDLMEVPQAGDSGKEEILKFIALMYGIYAIKIRTGEIARNYQAQTLQQAAELLFRMDWGRIGDENIDTMLDEYRKGAEAGNAYAQYKLGCFYLKGRYVAEDEAQGLALLEKAAAQDLYLAVDAMSDHYYWLAHPFAGDYGGASKEQIQAWTAAYKKWSAADDRVLAMVEQAYANSFTGYIENSGNVPTRGEVKVPEESKPEAQEEDNEEHRGFLGETDKESGFTCLDLPEVITGPYGVTYRRTSLSANSADYWSDQGDSTTIHLSDIIWDGQQAKNSDGYFYW